LLRATDPRKDQSYVLYMATSAQLAHTLLPVGELTKDAVRAHAAALGLRVANKPESFDVCFIPSGDTAGYLAQHLEPSPGEVVDLDGTVVGEHEGIWNFTVGQRRGLGLGTHERRFVVDVDAPTNRVVVGTREALACGWIEVGDLVLRGVADPTRMQVRLQIRAHGSTVPAHVTRTGAGVRITVDEPLHGVARGQAAVLYDEADEVCLGGGRITAAERPALPVTVTGAR
jgi:tRNA-specific 2-thiouridylase